MSNDARYNVFVARMEAEVTSLMGMDCKEMETLTGRTKGPTFVQSCALDVDIAGTRKTTSVSRAWRRTAGWLSDLMRVSKVVEVKAACH